MRALKRLATYIQPFFIALAVLCIVLVLAQQWEQLRAYPWRLHGGWLALSTLFLLASWTLEIAIWRHLLRLVGGELPFWPAVRIWFLSAIVRYVPGNIWHPLSMTLRCHQRGVAPAATLTSVALYQVVILLAVLPIAAVYFALTGNFGLLNQWLHGITRGWRGVILVGAGSVPLLLFLVRPQWLIGLINWGLQRLGNPLLDARLSTLQLLTVLLIAVADWLLWGAAFAAMTFALAEYAPSELRALTPHLVAAYPIAYAIGFISFITPSGFGVREGVFYLLLAPLLGGGAITIAALAARIWTTLGELAAAALSLPLELRAQRTTAAPSKSPAIAAPLREL